MKIVKAKLLPLVMLGVVSAPLITLTACGGGGSGGSETIRSRSKKLVGKVYGKLIGDKIGQLKADLKELTTNTDLTEMSGTVEFDGHEYPFTTTVGADHKFFVRFDETSPPDLSGGRTVLASVTISGTLDEPTAAAPDSLSITDGKWVADLPTPNSAPGVTTTYRGSIESGTSTSTTPPNTGTAPATGSCEWSPTSFYNAQQVASYQGVNYTASKWVTPFGAAGAILFNPAADIFNWTKGGTCGPTPFVKVLTAHCAKGATADVVTMTGTALGGGIGDAIVAYTNLTDQSFSNENNFGLPGSSYSMTCAGGGFVSGAFSSGTTPSYSVCVKKQVSSAETQWSSTQTIPRSNTSVKITTAYASKGQPNLATVFSPGAIVLGLDAVRGTGFTAFTGNCN